MITGFYTGLLTLLVIGLAFRVIAGRRRLLVGLGDGDDPALGRAIRAHGNCVEYVPLGLVLMVILEMTGTPAPALHAVGLCLVGGRVLHAFGLSRDAGASFGRASGMILTFIALTAAAATGMIRFGLAAFP